MKHVLTCTFCVLLAACGATTGPTVVASQADSPKRNSIATLPANPVQDASFGLILNDLRQKSGADPVTFDIRLNAAAQAHAEDMLARGYFNHRNQAGQSEYDRIVAAGYNPKNWGENIAQGQQSEAGVMTLRATPRKQRPPARPKGCTCHLPRLVDTLHNPAKGFTERCETCLLQLAGLLNSWGERL